MLIADNVSNHLGVFNETKVKSSEYFIIGTLSSLTWTIIIFAFFRFVMDYL